MSNLKNLTPETIKLLQQLQDGFIKIQNGNVIYTRKHHRLQAKQVKHERMKKLKDLFIPFIEKNSDGYFSVKHTSNSLGLLPLVDDASITRDHVLQWLKEASWIGILVKVGLKGGKEYPADQVNSFQIRYRIPLKQRLQEIEDSPVFEPVVEVLDKPYADDVLSPEDLE